MFGLTIIKKTRLEYFERALAELKKKSEGIYERYTRVIELNKELEKAYKTRIDAIKYQLDAKTRTIDSKNACIRTMRRNLCIMQDNRDEWMNQSKMNAGFLKAAVQINEIDERELKQRIHRLQMAIRYRDKKIIKINSEEHIAELSVKNTQLFNKNSELKSIIYKLEQKNKDLKKCLADSMAAIR